MFPELCELVREFAGSSITDRVMMAIRMLRPTPLDIGGLRFSVKKMCTCDRACGGIFCEGVKVYQLVGNANVLKRD